MSTGEKLLNTVLVVIILFCFYGCTQGMKQHEKFRKDCEAAGGIPFQPKYDNICLKKDQVQEMSNATH